jgi:Contact-dependent growth inhibition CdiA C-terminal domain
MTLTLEPELAGLLDRTGHAWPDADEDQLVAMARGWGDLADRLEQVHAEHRSATGAILEGNSGLAIGAFGDWAGQFHEWLLGFVEQCAQIRAWLMSIAQWVFDTKNAIIGVLEDLRKALDDLERELKKVPIIGETLAGGVENTAGALLDRARSLIGKILDALTSPILDHIVPALIGLVAGAQGVVQGLRRLLKGQSGADRPTTPSAKPHPGNQPRGPKAAPRPKDKDPANARALRLENEAALTLARNGYDIEQMPPRTDGSKSVDYVIEGKKFDCYAPTTLRARNIWSQILDEKVRNGQTDRVIIDVDSPDIHASVNDLRRQFQENPMPGLTEAKVIAPGGAIIDIYP